MSRCLLHIYNTDNNIYRAQWQSKIRYFFYHSVGVENIVMARAVEQGDARGGTLREVVMINVHWSGPCAAVHVLDADRYVSRSSEGYDVNVIALLAHRFNFLDIEMPHGLYMFIQSHTVYMC